MEEEKKEHASYGMIQINKFSGNGSTFFGSDLSHSGGISITICEGSVRRGLSTDWYHAGSELVEVEMSHSQYVDAITSGMNTGGVPCTIRRKNGKFIEKANFITDKKRQFTSEMESIQTELSDKIDSIFAKVQNSKIGVRLKSELMQELKVLHNHFSGNTNFVLKQFNKAMDKTVTEAKHSISGYIDNKIHTLGIEAMRDQLQISLTQEK